MMKLNEQQQKAVEQIDGASLIISGAGCGKSLSLAAKVEGVLNHDV